MMTAMDSAVYKPETDKPTVVLLEKNRMYHVKHYNNKKLELQSCSKMQKPFYFSGAPEGLPADTGREVGEIDVPDHGSRQGQ